MCFFARTGIPDQVRGSLAQKRLGLCLPLHRSSEKGRKVCWTGANMLRKIGDIEVNMGEIGKKSAPPKDDGKSKKPRPVEDDDLEDGDIATPKRDRSGDDDEPLS